MPERVEITGPVGDRYEEILTQEAADLLAALHGELADRRAELLAARRRRQAELSGGAMLDFLPATAHIREDMTWRVAPPAPGLVGAAGAALRSDVGEGLLAAQSCLVEQALEHRHVSLLVLERGWAGVRCVAVGGAIVIRGLLGADFGG